MRLTGRACEPAPAHGLGYDQNTWRLVVPAVAAFARVVTSPSGNRADLARVGLPMLVAQRSSDGISPLAVGASVHARIPGSRLVTLNATGHSPQLAPRQGTAAGFASFAGAAR